MRFKAIIIISTIFLSFLSPLIGHAEEEPIVSANNAVLIEQSTGRILFAKKEHEKQNIASITKIMTAILAIESGKMDELAKASRKAVYTEGSSIYLTEGEKMKLEDLVYGLMMRSGNDAAIAIAEHVGGSEEGFVYLMNEKANWLGMLNTHFDNPHGLDSDTHYSSAYDMALLMRYAMQNEDFQTISGTKFYKPETREYGWKNKNKLLTAYYNYCTGGKTGFTKKTGRTLVTTASKNGMNLIAVTLDAPNDWRDHIAMFEWGFKQYDMEPLGGQGFIDIQLGSKEEIRGYIQEGKMYPLKEEEEASLRFEIEPVTIKLPWEGEHIIAKQKFYLHDEPITEVVIYRDKKQDTRQNSYFSNLIAVFQKILRMG